MAEPIRNYTPIRDPREELRRKIDNASIDHAAALLAGYELLQAAQDHGVLDFLRGTAGAGTPAAGKISEYANTSEGIRLLRNLLAGVHALGELDPAILDAAAEALARVRDAMQTSRPPSLLRSFQRLTGPGSRRAVAIVAEFAESFGSALDSNRRESGTQHSPLRMATGAAVPVLASTVILMAFSFWIGRRSLSR